MNLSLIKKKMILLTLLLLVIPTNNTYQTENSEALDHSMVPLLSDVSDQIEVLPNQIMSSPIIIDGNSALSSYMTEHNFGGSGSVDDKYVISNLILNSTDQNYQIYFKNINAHVIIQNMSISNGLKGGIRLDASSNIHILNNIIHKNIGDGVFLNGTSNIIIENNIIKETRRTRTVFFTIGSIQYSNYPFAIDVYDSNNIQIRFNQVYENIDGIWFWQFVTNSVMANNTIYNSVNEGAGTGGAGSHDNIIANNTIVDTRFGIWVYTSKDSDILNNIIINSDEGLRLEGMTGGTIIGNILIGNTEGISAVANLSFAGNNANLNIRRNLVLNSSRFTLNFGGSNFRLFQNSFIYENETNNYLTIVSGQFNFTGNHYSDWTQPDLDGDGIVDNPNVLDEGISDPLPYVNAFHNISHYNLIVEELLITLFPIVPPTNVTSDPIGSDDNDLSQTSDVNHAFLAFVSLFILSVIRKKYN